MSWQQTLPRLCLSSAHIRATRETSPLRRLKILFQKLNQCLSWFRRTTIQLFFLFHHSTRKHSFLWIFMNSCPTPGANWKNPAGQFQHREAYCSFNRAALSGQEFRSQCLGTPGRGFAFIHKHGSWKTPSLWWLPLQTPQSWVWHTCLYKPGHLSGRKPRGIRCRS